MSSIRKVVTARIVVEVPDTDEWAAEYGLDPTNLGDMDSDVESWLNNAVQCVLTEMQSPANNLLVTNVEHEIVATEVDGVPVDPTAETGRQIRVTWQTEETREYDEVIVVPDEVGDSNDEIAEWIYDGNNSALVEAEETAKFDLPSFLRDTLNWEFVVDEATGDIADENGVVHGNIHEG